MSENERDRPDPDKLLSAVNHEERRNKEGKLKIFLGMVAGVGKTYAMLQAAHQLKAQGEDVVVGFVETHGRKDTAALLHGLEVLPRLKIPHRGVTLTEMNLDALLKRRPSIVLVDELAHTNAPGTRHTKRYLDVQELLRNGINVYTTLNVQHLESRVGTVQEITGAAVHETVPDLFLDEADEIVLVDLAPDELLKRMKEGKIYPAERVETATLNFFRKGNLTALREMALRLAAERVDRELRQFKILHGIEQAWKSGNRLMVAVFASPYAETIIRWTRRMADALDATWIGATVLTHSHYTTEEKNLLTKNLNLVQQLGGEVISTQDANPVAGLLRIARQNNVTQIVVGKTQRGWWQNFLRGGSVVQRLLRSSSDIDIYVARANMDQAPRPSPASLIQRYPWGESGSVLAIGLATWLLAAALHPFIGYLAVGIIFIISVSISGLFLSRASVIALAFIFASIHNFFFIPPLNTLTISKPEDILTLVTIFIAAVGLGHLTTQLKRKEVALRYGEDKAVTLFQLTKQIAAAQSVVQVNEAAIAVMQKSFPVPIAVFLEDRDNPRQIHLAPGSSFRPTRKELTVAKWVKTHGRMAGKGTETLPASDGVYFPLQSREKVWGVLAFDLEDHPPFDTAQVSLAEMFANQLTAGIERELYHSENQRLEVLEETQRLYRTLLNSVSHELKTPLASIKGSASALLDPVTSANEESRSHLAHEILCGTDRLRQVVDNLLDMTRIESGMLHPRKDLSDVNDIVGAAMHKVQPLRGEHQVSVWVEKNLPPIRCDQALLVQALMNVIHNAFVHTPAKNLVEIVAKKANDSIDIVIRDHGRGLPKVDPQKVFEKFFREDSRHTGGLGLGLSIASGFIELQEGKLLAENHPAGGAQFTIRIPIEKHHES